MNTNIEQSKIIFQKFNKDFNDLREAYKKQRDYLDLHLKRESYIREKISEIVKNYNTFSINKVKEIIQIYKKIPIQTKSIQLLKKSEFNQKNTIKDINILLGKMTQNIQKMELPTPENQ